MFQPEGRNVLRLEHGRNSLFFGCCSHRPTSGLGVKILNPLSLITTRGWNSRNSRNKRGNQACSDLFRPAALAGKVRTPEPLPAPTARARFALWLEHHARTAQSPQRAAEEAAATCRGLYPHQARTAGKETPL
jgi:hypothetical protein